MKGEGSMAQAGFQEPDLGFIRDVKQAGGNTLKNCYQCATCSVVCNLSPADKPFPRKEMIWAQWGQKDRLLSDPDVWLCHQCNDCTTYCPRGARPGDVLAAVRSYAYKTYAFPRFMGKALASPRALPLLIGVPLIIMLALIYLTAPVGPDGQYIFMTSDVIDFNLFLPHSTVDAFFVFGNVLIFLFAAIGFARFWTALKRDGAPAQMSFVSALTGTIKEILSHTKFRDCGANRPRAVGHMLLLFGFIGAMITTGLVLLFVFIPHYFESWFGSDIPAWAIQFTALPFDLPHPIKVLGAVSGVALLIGSLMLLYRRWTDADSVGANGYADHLFLYVIFITGLTGMLAWLSRYLGAPMLSYVIYFVHILAVYFLLWYMPYSKFAHMIYRTLALVRARQIGRQARELPEGARQVQAEARPPASMAS
ncbi:heterodisulfide reductase [candidate division GN15 bacterium]|nr:heterodisulfide reductase [candidate division GN15 bacterium]